MINLFFVTHRFYHRPRAALAASRARRQGLHPRCSDSYHATPDIRRSARAAGKTTAVDSTRAAPRLPIAIGALLGLLAVPACTAGEASARREHGAHHHGVGHLDLVAEGEALYLELTGPAASLAGFEHAASTKAETRALAKTLAVLEDGERLFRFSPAAGCRLHSASVDAPLTSPATPDSRSDATAGGHAAPTGTPPGRVQAGHADIRADYHFVCTEPGRVERLNVRLFQDFPAVERVQVQFIWQARQGAATLTADNPVIRF